MNADRLVIEQILYYVSSTWEATSEMYGRQVVGHLSSVPIALLTSSHNYTIMITSTERGLQMNILRAVTEIAFYWACVSVVFYVVDNFIYPIL